MHTDDMNDLVLMGLARDAAEAEAKALRARVQELEAALQVDPWKVGFAHWKALRTRALQKQEGE